MKIINSAVRVELTNEEIDLMNQAFLYIIDPEKSELKRHWKYGKKRIFEFADKIEKLNSPLESLWAREL